MVYIVLKEISHSRTSKENRYKLSEQRFLATSVTCDWLMAALKAHECHRPIILPLVHQNYHINHCIQKLAPDLPKDSEAGN